MVKHSKFSGGQIIGMIAFYIGVYYGWSRRSSYID